MRLDRYDSYLKEFHATVLQLREDERGLWARLDRSAFYPTAGGQPHDTGSLTVTGGGGAGITRFAVTDVEDVGGEVWQRLEAGAPTPRALQVGDAVVGRIDWSRRYRHMQRHTGQHLLSQALVRVNEAYGTRSVSMRGPDCTIDFGGEADEAALAAVEREVNEAARHSLAVMTFEIDDSRLGEYRLRRPAKVSGLVRLVAIGDYDLVACGGTHLRSSAEALPIKIVGLERVKGGTNRLTFRAGEEAQEDYARKHAVTSALGVALSAPIDGLVPRLEQLRQEAAELARELAEARRLQATALAERLAAEAESSCVTAYLAGDQAALFESVVEQLQQRPNTVSLVAAEAPGAAGTVRFAFLAGPGAGVDVRPALAAALGPLGGRGGGRPDRAQGAAQAEPERARAALRSAAAHLAAG